MQRLTNDTVRNAVSITWAAWVEVPVTGSYQLESPAEQSLADFLEQVFAEFNNRGEGYESREPELPSLSVGDLIHFWDRHFIVAPAGFREITREEVEAHKRQPRRDRTWVNAADGQPVPEINTVDVVLGLDLDQEWTEEDQRFVDEIVGEVTS